jgi:hypothetical protein
MHAEIISWYDKRNRDMTLVREQLLRVARLAPWHSAPPDTPLEVDGVLLFFPPGLERRRLDIDQLVKQDKKVRVFVSGAPTPDFEPDAKGRYYSVLHSGWVTFLDSEGRQVGSFQQLHLYVAAVERALQAEDPMRVATDGASYAMRKGRVPGGLVLPVTPVALKAEAAPGVPVKLFLHGLSVDRERGTSSIHESTPLSVYRPAAGSTGSSEFFSRPGTVGFEIQDTSGVAPGSNTLSVNMFPQGLSPYTSSHYSDRAFSRLRLGSGDILPTIIAKLWSNMSGTYTLTKNSYVKDDGSHSLDFDLMWFGLPVRVIITARESQLRHVFVGELTRSTFSLIWSAESAITIISEQGLSLLSRLAPGSLMSQVAIRIDGVNGSAPLGLGDKLAMSNRTYGVPYSVPPLVLSASRATRIYYFGPSDCITRGQLAEIFALPYLYLDNLSPYELTTAVKNDSSQAILNMLKDPNVRGYRLSRGSTPGRIVRWIMTPTDEAAALANHPQFGSLGSHPLREWSEPSTITSSWDLDSAPEPLLGSLSLIGQRRLLARTPSDVPLLLPPYSYATWSTMRLAEATASARITKKLSPPGALLAVGPEVLHRLFVGNFISEDGHEYQIIPTRVRDTIPLPPSSVELCAVLYMFSQCQARIVDLPRYVKPDGVAISVGPLQSDRFTEYCSVPPLVLPAFISGVDQLICPIWTLTDFNSRLFAFAPEVSAPTSRSGARHFGGGRVLGYLRCGMVRETSPPSFGPPTLLVGNSSWTPRPLIADLVRQVLAHSAPSWRRVLVRLSVCSIAVLKHVDKNDKMSIRAFLTSNVRASSLANTGQNPTVPTEGGSSMIVSGLHNRLWRVSLQWPILSSLPTEEGDVQGF